MRIKKISTYINDLWKNRFSESLGNTICQQNINNHFRRVWTIWIILVYDWICVNIFSWFHIKMSFWFCLCFLSFLMKKWLLSYIFMLKKLFWQENPNGLKFSSQWFQSVITIFILNHCNNFVDSSQSLTQVIVMIFRKLWDIPFFSWFSVAILLKLKLFLM